MKFFAIFIDTFREIRDKKMLITFGIITAIFACTYIFGLSTKPAGNGNIETTFFGDSETINAIEFVQKQMMFFSHVTTGIILFLFIITFAFVIANLLKPGTLDLHLSKPLWRPQLLLYKFLACVSGVLVLMLIMTATFWSILSWKAGVITLQPFIFTFMAAAIFAISFSVITFCCVLTRGAGAGISIYLVYAYLLQGVLQSRESIKAGIDSPLLANVLDSAYHILPKINECLTIATKMSSGKETNFYPLTSSLIFMGVTLIVSCIIFQRKDY
ncbi:ABC transporter permease subunit [Candidatus Uabimicrobium sp. HlEnr_7]|uniref:ABC transporter permease subunit n=1 Tax=Candidatus Uabimicrobium helgolandensis TaxID=3095367 RepID=UPI003558537E